MNRSVLNRTLLNTSVLCQSRLNQSGLASQRGKSGGIPAAIRQAMVLWYDIARQGCTNEAMKENPVLRDLSGNGHDATCYNFGWTEGSGISTVDYPGALVSDGVDDYCYVEGLPILTKEEGYTVVAKRKWTADLSVTPVNKCFVSDVSPDGAPLSGAFTLDLELSTGNNYQNFGARSTIDIELSDIIWQTSKYYCGNPINIGSNQEGAGLLNLFRFGASYPFQGAFYSLALFDRDLTAEEIEWVKTNLITA